MTVEAGWQPGVASSSGSVMYSWGRGQRPLKKGLVSLKGEQLWTVPCLWMLHRQGVVQLAHRGEAAGGS